MMSKGWKCVSLSLRGWWWTAGVFSWEESSMRTRSTAPVILTLWKHLLSKKLVSKCLCLIGRPALGQSLLLPSSPGSPQILYFPVVAELCRGYSDVLMFLVSHQRSDTCESSWRMFELLNLLRMDSWESENYKKYQEVWARPSRAATGVLQPLDQRQRTCTRVCGWSASVSFSCLRRCFLIETHTT